LIGIGERVEEIVDSLFAIKQLNDEYGHIQEIIIQNFRAKPDTPMKEHPEPSHEFMRNVVAVTRLLFGKEMNVQVPPNLTPSSYPDFLMCGINDWGGISPVTKDFVNPEAPWPEVQLVRRACEQHGLQLKARLPVYPEFIFTKPEFIPESVKPLIQSMIGEDGYVSWSDM